MDHLAIQCENPAIQGFDERIGLSLEVVPVELPLPAGEEVELELLGGQRESTVFIIKPLLVGPGSIGIRVSGVVFLLEESREFSL